jgi:hypothetical protein
MRSLPPALRPLTHPGLSSQAGGYPIKLDNVVTPTPRMWPAFASRARARAAGHVATELVKRPASGDRQARPARRSTRGDPRSATHRPACTRAASAPARASSDASRERLQRRARCMRAPAATAPGSGTHLRAQPRVRGVRERERAHAIGGPPVALRFEGDSRGASSFLRFGLWASPGRQDSIRQ